MHHANLPIEIIIKRYLWRREPEEWVLGPLGTPASPSMYRNLAAPASFAPSAYNIRCAKIEKPKERKKKGRGRKEERIEFEDHPAERGKENIGVPSWAGDLYRL